MEKKGISLYQFLTVLFIILIGLISALIVIEFTKASDSTSKETIESKMSNPVVEFQTSKGNFKVELFLKESPITAGNFKELVEDGFYDGTRFHRVIKDFMIQGGDPMSKNLSLRQRWGTGGPGYTIEDEFIHNLSNTRGTLSMANSGPQSGGSQFFINVVDNTYLDWDKQPTSSKHPVFGKVVEGMDVVDKISTVKTSGSDQPAQDIVVEKVILIK